MMKVWLQPPGVQGFSEFVFQQIVPACFNAILKPGFRLKDMECQLVIKAVVGTCPKLRGHTSPNCNRTRAHRPARNYTCSPWWRPPPGGVPQGLNPWCLAWLG